MLKNFGFAIALAVAPLSAVADAQANLVTDAEGVWSGGFQRERLVKFLVSARFIDGHGLVQITDQGWTVPKQNSVCQYHFAYEEMDVGPTYLNEAVGRPENCIAEFPFSIERVSDDVLRLAPEPGLASMLGIEAFDMQAGLRPPRPQDMHAQVDNLDILGVSLGMEHQAVRAVLEEKGYKFLDEEPLNFRNHTARTERWVKGEADERAPTFVGSSPYPDTINLAFSGEAEWIEGAPYLVNISRHVKPGDSASLTELTMQQAYIDKYGNADVKSSEDRSFDRQGNPDPRFGNCRSNPGPHQRVSYQLKSKTIEMSIYCGPQFTGGISSDRSTGMVKSYFMNIQDPDPIWRDFWMTWAKPQGDELEAMYKSLSREVSAAPEL